VDKESDHIRKLLDDAQELYEKEIAPRCGRTSPSPIELILTALLVKQVRHHIKEEGEIIDTVIQMIEENIEEEGDKYIGHGWHDANVNLLKKIRKKWK